MQDAMVFECWEKDYDVHSIIFVRSSDRLISHDIHIHFHFHKDIVSIFPATVWSST